ncbi:MAG: hypothetical protein U0232_07830 [Thermomicrobiales bacterium]
MEETQFGELLRRLRLTAELSVENWPGAGAERPGGSVPWSGDIAARPTGTRSMRWRRRSAWMQPTAPA